MPKLFTYSGDPNSTPKDAVRFYVGDTITEDPQLGDYEIYFLLNQEGGSVLRAAARAAEALVAKYSRKIDKRIDRLDLHSEALMKHYQELATMLWSRATIPASFGTSFVDASDLVDPFFTRTTGDFGPTGTSGDLTSSSFYGG
jgi:hypothetical protein